MSERVLVAIPAFNAERTVGSVVRACRDVLDDPQDPYTQRLRASVTRPGWKPGRRDGAGTAEEIDVP